MTRKIVIHPTFRHLEKDIIRILDGNYTADVTFRNQRNTVEKITLQEYGIVVKKYRCPNITNRFAYTHLRKSKAQRAYEYALRLIDHGVETPFPVAYCEEKRNGIFHTGYFLSLYMPYDTLSDAYAGDIGEEMTPVLTRQFMDFTIGLNRKRILHKDFNSSNILYHYDPKEQKYRFALTDINRMRFGKRISTSEAMHSFEQLGVPAERIYRLALYYSQQIGVDIEYTMFVFLFHRIWQRIRKGFKSKAREKLKMQ